MQLSPKEEVIQMTPGDIRKQYERITKQELETREKLDAARAAMATAKEDDISAAADAALAGEAAPKLKAVRLSHAIENLSVTLAGLDEAVYRLQQQAIELTGADRPAIFHGDPDAEAHRGPFVDGRTLSVAEEAVRQRSVDVGRRLPRLAPDDRPTDLIEWVQRGYDEYEAVARAGVETQVKEERYQRGIRAEAVAKRKYMATHNGDLDVNYVPEEWMDADDFADYCIHQGAVTKPQRSQNIPIPDPTPTEVPA
jgi:hypothetical protein